MKRLNCKSEDGKGADGVMSFNKHLLSPGMKFGKLEILKDSGQRKNGIIWECKCDCGNHALVVSSKLSTGHTSTCGCGKKNAGRKSMKNLIGQKFNRLLVLSETNKRAGKNIIWRCKCDCGSISDVAGSKLVRGHTKSCGCYQNEKRMESGRNTKNLKNFKGEEKPLKYDYTGRQFGRLTVIKRSKRRASKDNTYWWCQCECGKITRVGQQALKNGLTKSCGCYNRDIKRTLPKEAYDKFIGKDSKRLAFYLSDGYVKGTMAHAYGIQASKVDQKMLKLKREQLKMNRKLKELKEQINGTSGTRD